ncbi:MAG: NAD(P)/FAD-dependent oxidoreductase [Bacilli bacterium]|nr:NAD(P)/FAD-dependent oxidoreductase [Bacilli bacterium]
MKNYNVIVIGSGPAGMMAAIRSSLNNKVLLIEKNDKLGKKLSITGGGRCNLLNLKNVDEFIKEIAVNAKSFYSVLKQISPKDLYDYFVSIGVMLKEEDNNRIFPVSNKSITIIEALNKQLKLSNVDINLNEIVIDIKIEENNKVVITNKGRYICQKLIIATGGCSYPQTGSTGDGYKFAKLLNHDITDLYPAETFLITKEKLPLAGLTLDNVTVMLDQKKVEGSMLFTHNGVSGPVIFRISEEVYKKINKEKQAELVVDLLPDYSYEKLINSLNNYNSKKEIASFVRQYLPKRLSDYLVLSLNINTKIAEMSKINKQKIIESIKQFRIKIKKTGNIETSIVTGGGVNLKDINMKTMESKLNKGVYFVGELLDIHGHTGGYNITIALATGYVAGEASNN